MVSQVTSPLRRALLFIFLCAELSWACTGAAKTAPSFGGVVSIADGEPFTVVRGTNLNTATKGVALTAGDMVATGADAFLVVSMRGGDLVGIGPSTEVYFMQRTASEGPTLVVLKGWVKADLRGTSEGPDVRVLGTHLGFRSHHAVVLLHVDEESDSMFDEQGSGTLLLRDEAATRTGASTVPNQFLVREERADVTSRPGPSPQFVKQMPIPFRDSLPAGAAAKLKKTTELQFVRAVNYADVEQWLNMLRDWRAGLIRRFRRRLKDPEFFAAMDASMARHPEWQLILHPPPPPPPPPPQQNLQAPARAIAH